MTREELFDELEKVSILLTITQNRFRELMTAIFKSNLGEYQICNNDKNSSQEPCILYKKHKCAHYSEWGTSWTCSSDKKE